MDRRELLLLGLVLAFIACGSLWAASRARRVWLEGTVWNHWEQRELRGREAKRVALAWILMALMGALACVATVGTMVAKIAATAG